MTNVNLDPLWSDGRRSPRLGLLSVLLSFALTSACVSDPELTKRDAQADSGEDGGDSEGDSDASTEEGDDDASATGGGDGGGNAGGGDGGAGEGDGGLDGSTSNDAGGSGMDGGTDGATGTGDGGADGGTGATDAGSDGTVGGDGGPGSGGDGSVPNEDMNRYRSGLGATGSLAYAVTTAETHAVPGGLLRYLITLSNTSNAQLQKVKVTWTVPQGLSFAAAGAMPSAYCGGSGTCSPGAQATWTLETLAAGASRTISVDAAVLANQPVDSQIDALLRFEATGINPSTLTKTVAIKAGVKADVQLTATRDLVQPGEAVRYRVGVGQLHDMTLSGSKLTLQLPGGVEVVGVSHSGSYEEGQISWPLADMPVGSTWQRWVDVKIPVGTPGAKLLPARAALTAPDATVYRQSEHVISTTSAVTPLLATISWEDSPTQPNGFEIITINVANHSERGYDDVKVVLELPDGVSFVAGGSSFPDAYCGGSGTCANFTKPTWSLGTMPAGASRVIAFEAGFSNSLNYGRVSRLNLETSATDAPFLRQSIALPVTFAPAARLLLSSQERAIVPGENATLQLDIGQVGAAALDSSELRLRLPAGLSLVSASDGGALDTSGEVVWSLGTIAVTATRHLSVQVASANTLKPGDLLQSEARLTFAGVRFEPLITSHWVIRTTDVAPALSLTIAESPNPVAPAAVAAYTLTVTNTAARAINGVSLVLRNQEGLSFTAAAAAEPDAYCGGSGTCGFHSEPTWNIGTLGVGASQIITINATVANTTLLGSLLRVPMHLTATGVEVPTFVQHVLRVGN